MAIATDKRIYFKPLSLLTGRMVPDYVLAEYPQLVLFLKYYFEYMEKELGQFDVITNLLNYRDIDNTLDIFEDSFKERFLNQFPEALAANVDILVKNIRTFYKSKGTEDSFKFIFSVLFNSDMTIFYPKTKILKASDGVWFSPEYLIFEDERGNIPAIFSDNSSFNLVDLVGQYLFGVTTGAVALVDGVTYIPYGGQLEEHVQILSKTGSFTEGEQVVLGNNIIENGDFNDHTNFWNLSIDDGFMDTNLLNELEIIQNPVDIFDKYISQRVVVSPNDQYYLRYSMVANKAGLVDATPRFDSDLARVTVGSTEGADDIFNSGKIGSYVNFDPQSLQTIDRDIRWQPAITSLNGVKNIYHINYDLHADPAAYTPIGAGLTQKSTARVVETTQSPRFDKDFSASLHVTVGTDTIDYTDHDFKTADVVTLFDNGNTLPTGLATDTEYFIIIVNSDSFKLAASKADALTGTPVTITGLGSGTITIKTVSRVHLSAIGTEADFVTKTTIDPSNGYILLAPITDPLTATNFYVYSAGQSYALDDYAIKDDILYKSLVDSNTLDPADDPIVDWVKIPTALVNGPVELGSVNTLKLLPTLNSIQDVIYVTIWNEMTTPNDTCTFDGLSLVKKDNTSTPNFFITNKNGESGVVTRTLGETKTIDAATDVSVADNTITYVDHAFQTADMLTLVDNGNTLPVGLGQGIDYYLIIVDMDTFKLALSAEDARAKIAVDITGLGAGLIDLTTIAQGQWYDDRGQLSSTMKLQDNDYYQEFSYEIQSGVSKIDFEQVLRDNLHPAGLKMFAKVQTLASDNSGEFNGTMSIVMEYYLRLHEMYLAGGDWVNLFDGATDVDPVTNNVTITGHQYNTGDVVQIRSNGNTIPTGLQDNHNYYIIYIDPNTVQFAAQLAHALDGIPMDITLDGAGSIYLYGSEIDLEFMYNLRLAVEAPIDPRLTYAQVEANRELFGDGLQLKLSETVASLPVGIFDTKANDPFEYQDSFDVTITP
jgi:hypothetical protein